MLIPVDRQDIVEVEHRLFPVSVFRMGSCGEPDRLVASRKLNVEPGDKGVRKVVASDLQRERGGEGKLRSGDSVQVD